MSYLLFSSKTLSQPGVAGVHNTDFKILKVVPNVCDFFKTLRVKSAAIGEAVREHEALLESLWLCCFSLRCFCAPSPQIFLVTVWHWELFMLPLFLLLVIGWQYFQLTTGKATSNQEVVSSYGAEGVKSV